MTTDPDHAGGAPGSPGPAPPSPAGGAGPPAGPVRRTAGSVVGGLTGYVTSAAGAVVGAAAGGTAGGVAAPAVFTYVLRHLDAGSAHRDPGLAGVLEAIAVALALVVVAALAATAVAVAAVWLGSVVACGLALRLVRCGYARRTAVLLAAVEPPVLFCLLWVLHAAGQGRASLPAVGAAVAGSACLARYLAVTTG